VNKLPAAVQLYPHRKPAWPLQELPPHHAGPHATPL